MKLTMTELGAPQGTYRAKFAGVQPREPMAGTDYGPGLEWRFEIVDGPHRGRVVARTTSPEPTLKNSCGRMLTGLAGGALRLGEEFDPAAYLGRLYVVTVEVNSTGSGTRVGTVVPVEAFGQAAPSGPITGPPAAPRPGLFTGPPPRPPAQAAPARRWWVAEDPEADAVEMDDAALAEFITTRQRDPKT